jgi:hypothetical protein
LKGRREHNIRMDLREMVLEFVDWMHLAEDMDQWGVFVNTVIDFQVGN